VIARRVRAFDPFPGAVTTLDGEDLKIWSATAMHPPSHNGLAAPGTVVNVGGDYFAVACGTGLLLVRDVQRPGGKRQSVAQWLRAQPLAEGTALGG
jgi:methionyl-tRNA formyltransferase